jgi:hypothetical protein
MLVTDTTRNTQHATRHDTRHATCETRQC